MKLPAFLLALLSVALGGCVATRFESLPNHAFAPCDTRWIGDWRVEMEGVHDNEPTFLSIGKQCKEILCTYEDGKEHFSDLELHFGRVNGMDILAGQQLASSSPAESATESSDPTGYYYFRYDAGPDRISIHAVDSKRVAQWLIDGKLLGSVDYTSKLPGGTPLRHGSTLDNFVAGDSAAMEAALKRRGLFEKHSLIRLTRVKEIPTSTLSATCGKTL